MSILPEASAAFDVATLPVIYHPQPTDDFILRTAGEPLSMTHAAVSAIHSMASDIAVLEPQTMEDRISATVEKPQFATVLVAFFAGAALFLAAIGIFGVVAHSTAQRTHEIGIRIALAVVLGRRRDRISDLPAQPAVEHSKPRG